MISVTYGSGTRQPGVTYSRAVDCKHPRRMTDTPSDVAFAVSGSTCAAKKASKGTSESICTIIFKGPA